MTKATIRELQVRRMPGFESGGLKLADLAAGVNVVYGPNASGKSTLSRALELVANTKDRKEPWSLLSTLEVEGVPYRLDYNHGVLDCQQQGRPAELPKLAPADVGRHYLLALHELMQADSSGDLAQTILREAAGGYDLPTARDAIGAGRQRATGKGKLNRALEEAIAHKNACEHAQVELHRQESQLEDLAGQRDQAEQARDQLEPLAKALEWRAAEQQVIEAREDMAAFAPSMARLRGDELERLAELRETIEQAEHDLNAAGIAQRDAERLLNESLLPETGVPAVVVTELREKCRGLDRIVAEIDQLETAAADAQRRRELALAELGPGFTPSAEKDFTSQGLEPLRESIRRYEAWRARYQAVQSIEKWLTLDPAGDPEALHAGCLLLQQWLARQEATRESSRLPGILWALAVASAVAAVALGLFVHPSWWLLLPVAVALGVAGWFVRDSRRREQARDEETLREELAALDIDPPPAWESGPVRAYLRQLQERQAAAEIAKEKAALRASLHPGEQLAQEGQHLEQERQQLCRQWGLSPELPPDALYQLAGALQRWHAAKDTLAGSQAKLEKRREQVKARLEAIIEQLDQYGSAQPRTPAAALAHVEQLAQRGLQHREAATAREHACQQADRLRPLLARRRQEFEQLFRQLDLDPAAETAEHTLREWCDQLPAYRDAKHALAKAEAVCESRAQALAHRADLLELTAEQLEDRREQAQRQSEPLKALNERIWGIERETSRAKESHDLEAALAKVEACRDELRQQREADVLAVIGHTLADHLIGQQKELARGGVLGRARDLFTRFTHGRYKLQIEPGAEPRFRAVDTALGQGQELSELSSGTRIQLLLAVRVAYIEEHERGCKLPLVFDETLGNSDERRAREIIEAAIEIALSGRQVIYFTAQYDEVLKWRHYCDQQNGIAYHEIDLAAERNFGKDERLPAWKYEVLQTEIEQPNGDDFLAYGRRLEVPPLDRRADLGGVHLWYLVEDLEQLHALLAGGINKWGQLENLVEHRQAAGLTRESLVFQQAAAAAHYLERLLEHWRIGRGRPVDRLALEQSGAITPNFLDDVSDLALELEGDGKALLAELDAGRVKRFRTDSREKLRDWLIDQAYIDEREILTAEAIREQLAPLAYDLHQQGLLERTRRDFLLAAVCGTSEPATSLPSQPR